MLCRHTAGRHRVSDHLIGQDDRKQRAHVLSPKVPRHFPDADFRTRTADKGITQDTSRGFEVVTPSPPVLLITHVILQDRNDVLATAHEPSSAGEVERAFKVGMYNISNPRAQECLIEP